MDTNFDCPLSSGCTGAVSPFSCNFTGRQPLSFSVDEFLHHQAYEQFLNPARRAERSLRDETLGERECHKRNYKLFRRLPNMLPPNKSSVLPREKSDVSLFSCTSRQSLYSLPLCAHLYSKVRRKGNWPAFEISIQFYNF